MIYFLDLFLDLTLHKSVVFLSQISLAGLILSVAAIVALLIKGKRHASIIEQSKAHQSALERQQHAATELERQQASLALQQLNQELEARVNQRTLELQQVSDRLELAIKSAKIGIWEWDAVSDRLIWDDQMCELYGIPPSEFLGSYAAWLETLHPDDVEAVNAAVDHVIKGERDFNIEYRVVWKDGSIRHIKAYAVVQRNEQGQAQRAIGINYDISGRKQAEDALEESRQKYYSLIQSVNGVVWEYDLQSDQFTFVSDRAEKFLGYPTEVWLTEPHFWKNHLYLEDRAEAEAAFAQALQEHRDCEMEYRMVTADGSLVWVHNISSILFEEQGKPRIICGVLIDIRERKRAETVLQATNQELIRATRLKDEFLANMSHELRTPLNAILGMTEGLQEQVFGPITERQLKALQTVERSGAHLLELINDILDLSKIEAGQIELDCVSVSVSHLCQSSLAFIKQQALQKRIQLEIKLQPNLPDLLVDERRIRQVLINLLNNAVKFTPAGGQITLDVTQTTEPVSADGLSPAFLRIAVTDTGIGISAENIPKLFQPFVQVDSALNRQYEGTGLGLALVKQITELHGGRIGLTSELGVGSCFTIELPYVTGHSTGTAGSLDGMAEAQLAVTSELGAVPPQTDANLAPLILLAEDNEANITTVSSYLTAKGYRILLANHGQTAIDLTKAHRPDLILMDIQMPGMDGLEATRQIRLDPDLANIPIIALTALAMTGDREKCLEAGANEYMTKPVPLKQLQLMIQGLLK